MTGGRSVQVQLRTGTVSLGRHCGQAYVPHLPRNPILRIGSWEIQSELSDLNKTIGALNCQCPAGTTEQYPDELRVPTSWAGILQVRQQHCACKLITECLACTEDPIRILPDKGRRRYVPENSVHRKLSRMFLKIMNEMGASTRDATVSTATRMFAV